MKNEIQFEDFTKIDIRIGTITAVNDFPEARIPAYKLTIDFGEIGTKQSSAQITVLYSKEELINRQVLAVVNFKKKQIANFFSECLVLGVANSAKEIVLLKASSEKLKNGIQIS